jgi:SAM-dependent methyltransferase
MTKKMIGSVTECQICSKKCLEKVLDLGHQPVVQEYLTKKSLKEPEVTYPLNLVRCTSCGLVQIDYIVDPKIVFPPHYPYRTGLTNMLVRNFLSLADTLEKVYPWKKSDLIVDIGSNDGTLLKGFQAKGMKVLGVEPTGAAKVANKAGIPTLQAFFDKKVVADIVKKHGKAHIVTATNVFAHINDSRSLVKNIASILDKDGVFVSESQYLMDIVEKLEFDTIYHEHLRFYSLRPLMKLFEVAGLTVVDAERISAAGGSIRVYAMKGKRIQSERVKEIIATEEKVGLYDSKKLADFADKVINAKRDLVSLLLSLKKQGSTLVGLSSAARSNTLLGFTKINEHILDYLGEKAGSPKIGMYTPGTHIPVVDEACIFAENPDYVVVLSWHIGNELVKKMKELGYKGKFVIPLPVPKVIE